MDEKTMQRIKKLQALAERGVGGEKKTAEEKLQKALEKHGIKSLEELQSEEREYTLFSYNGKLEMKLLSQCMYKVLTAAGDRDRYHSKGKRQKLGLYCTRAQKVEIEMEFDFYRKVLYEELDVFLDAFINAQQIFPPDAPVNAPGHRTERDLRVKQMAARIKKKTRSVMIDDKEGGRKNTP